VIVTVIVPMLFRVIAVVISMVVSMVVTVIIAMLFRVFAVIIAMVVSMASMTSLLNVHTTVKMLRLSPHQGGANLCFDRETSLVG
jgi:hypothetical protein